MNYPIWKPLVIVGLIVLFVMEFLVPATQVQLRPGLDLAGGTTLVYDVKLPRDTKDPKQTIDEMILVLNNRVDPTGTRNLIWRQIAGNRIEIQMALASADTQAKRDAFENARKALLEHNLRRDAVNQMLLLAGDAQAKRIDELAAGNAEQKARLQTLVEAHSAFVATVTPYRESQDDLKQANAVLRELPADAPEEQKKAMQAHIDSLFNIVSQRADAYINTHNAYNAAMDAALASNVNEAEMQRVLDLSNQIRGEQDASPRQAALNELIAKHPERKQQIDAVATTYAAYEKVKGPLDDHEDLISMLQGSGFLEFRIAAESGELNNEEEYREALKERGPRAGVDEPWRWFVVDDVTQYYTGNAAKRKEQQELLKADPTAFFTSFGVVGQQYNEEYYVLLANTRDMSITRDQKGWALTEAFRGVAQDGTPNLQFGFNRIGAQLMGALTGQNVNRPMAILLDNRVITSPPPNIQSQISDSGQITGNFSNAELDYMIRTLKSGTMQGALSKRPISIIKTGPALGQDNLNRGMQAAVWSLVVVSIFVVFYYFFAGGVTVFALLINMGLILAVMGMLQATFTLPGIAGIVLTIGMAVDANVLIFERIREELEAGADLRTALRLGYEKALSTILDANITTLITCIVLGYTASAEIKGFAVTLGIGIMATLFCALFVTRVLLEMYVEVFKGKNLAMLPTVSPLVRNILSPNINWLALRKIFFPLSASLLVIGMALVIYRGGNMLDIEFRGGTQVKFSLKDKETMPISTVRDKVHQYGEVAVRAKTADFNPASLSEADREVWTNLQTIIADAKQRYDEALAQIEVAKQENREVGSVTPAMPDFTQLREAQVVTVGDTEGDNANAFSIATLMQDPIAVSDVIKAAFAGKLEATRPIAFDGQNLEHPRKPVVFPLNVTDNQGRVILGENIDAPQVTTDVTGYLGGVAIVVDDMQPQATLGDLELRMDRIRRVLPARFQNMGHWEFQIVGLSEAGVDEEGQGLYDSAAIIFRDDVTNYVENPDAFSQSGGLAANALALTQTALERDTSLDSVSNFSSQVSDTMKQQAVTALALALLFVVAYIWIRFGGFGNGFTATIVMVAMIIIGGVIFLAIELIGRWLAGGSAVWDASGLRLLLMGVLVPLPLLIMFVVVMLKYPALRYGPAAILALVHDVAIALGLVAISGWVFNQGWAHFILLDPFKIDLAMVAACLTIVGYSLNDTIVVFDRIRENRGRLATASPEMINMSINQTISRTMLTSGTTFIAVFILYMIGGPGVHGFAFAMLIGIVVGTYSSIAIASPMLLIGGKLEQVTAVKKHEDLGGVAIPGGKA